MKNFIMPTQGMLLTVYPVSVSSTLDTGTGSIEIQKFTYIFLKIKSIY